MKRLLTLCLAAMLCLPAYAQQNSFEEELVYRTTLGKPKDVAFLVKKVGNPDLTDKMGYPLLYIAASRNDEAAFEVVKTLVEQGADVNFDGGLGNYPIIAAVQSDNIEIVEYLLDQGANYRAKDGFGISLLDYSRQSGNPLIRELIESTVQKDIQRMISGRTQRALDQMVYDLIYHGCALQYYTYYYDSGQDDVPAAEKEKHLGEHKKAVGYNMSKLRSNFRLTQSEVDQTFAIGKQAIFAEMESLISNRWRRQKGVGKPGDMEKRCMPIAAPYKDGVFDKANLDRRVEF